MHNKFLEYCENGNLSGVKEMIHNDTARNLTLGMNHGCKNRHINIVDYLCTSPEVPQYGYDHANIHANSDTVMLEAVRDKNMDVVRYVFDYMETHPYMHYKWVVAEAFRTGHDYPELLQYLIVEKNIDKELLMRHITPEEMPGMEKLYNNYNQPIQPTPPKAKL